MIARCHRSYATNYAWYGGLGIQVCQRWRENFWCFVLDMGDKPAGNYVLSRLDNDADYTPENCVWLLRSEVKTKPPGSIGLTSRKPMKKREQDRYCYNGVFYTMTELAALSGVSYATLCDRYSRGYTVERMVETPVDAQQSKNRRTGADRRLRELQEAAKYEQ